MAHILRKKPKYLFKDMFFHLKDFPGSSAGKESTCNAGDLGSILGLGRSPGGGNGYPLQYSGLENSMDSIVHGVAKSQRRLSGFHFGTSLFLLLSSELTSYCPYF